MNKFIIFTIILSVSVITVTADLVVRDYYNEGEGEASVISIDGSPDSASGAAEDVPETAPETENQESSPPESVIAQDPAPADPAPVPSEPYVPPPSSSNITEDKIRQAGFTSVIFNEEQFQGKVFQLLDITQFAVEAISFYELKAEDSPIASITEIALRDEIRAIQLYTLLQNKTKTYIDLTLNETNSFGDRSFYINHAKKPGEAFIAVRIGRTIYAFAYVKVYHPEIKKLITLLIP